MRRLVAAIRTSLLCWVLALSAIALCAIAPVRSWVMRNWLTWIFCAKVASSVPMAFRVIQALLAGQLPLKPQPAPAPAHAAHEEPTSVDVGLDTAAVSAAAAASTAAAAKGLTGRSKLASMFDDDDEVVCKSSSAGTGSSVGSLRSRSSLQRRDSASTIFSTLPSAAAGACCCGSELDLCGPPMAPVVLPELPMPVKVMGPRWLAPLQHAAGLSAAVVGAPAAAAVVPAPGPTAMLAVPPAALAVPPAAPAAGPAPPVLNPYRQMLGARAGALGSGMRAGSGMVGGAAAAVPAASGHPGGTPPLSLTYQARTRCQLASVKVRREPTDFAGTAANLVKHAAHAAMQQAVNAFQPPSPTSGACPSSGTVIVPSHIPLHPPAQDSAQHSAQFSASQAQQQPQKPAAQPPMLSPTSILSPATSSCADGSPAEAADGMAAQPPTAPAAASARHGAAPARPQQQLVAARGPGALAPGGPGGNPLAVTVQVVAVRGCVQLVASMHHVAAHSLPQQPAPRVRLTAGALQAEMHSLAACMLSRSSSGGENVAAAGAWAVRAGSPDLPNTPDIRSYSFSLHSAGSAGSSDALLGLSAQQPYELVPVVHNRGAAANACMDEEGVDNGVAAEGGCACVGTRQEWQLACVWPPCIAAAPEAQVVELLLLRVLPGSAQAASFTVRDGQGQGVKATVSASAAGTGVHASSTAVAVASLADWALQWADHSSMPPSAAGSAQHASSRAHAHAAGPVAVAEAAADGSTPRIGSFSSTSSIGHAADALAGLVAPDAPGAAPAAGASSAAPMPTPAAPSAALPLSSTLLEAHAGPANIDDMLDDDAPGSPLPSRASFASCAAGGMRPWLDDDSAGMLCGSPRSSLFSFLAAAEQPADGAASTAAQPPGSASALPPNTDLEVRVADPVSCKPAAGEPSSPLPSPDLLPTSSFHSPDVDAADEAAGHAAHHAAAAHLPAPPAMEADEFESMQDDEAGDACPPIVVPVLLHGARPLGASSTAAAAAPSGAGYLQGLQGWDPVDHPAMARNHHHMARNHGHVARSHDHLQPPSGSALSLQDYAAAAAAAGMVEEGAAMAHDLLGGQLDGQDFEHGMDGEEEGEGLLGGAEQRVRVLVVEPQGGGVVLDTRVVLTESALQQGHARVRVAIPAVNVSPSCLHIYVLDDNPLTAGAILAAPVLPVLPEIAARELTGFAHQQLSLSMYSSDEPAASVGDQVRCGLRCWQDLLQPLLTDIGFLLAEAPPSPGMDAMAMDPHGSATSPLHGEGHAVEEVAAAAGGSDKEQQQVSFRVAGEGTDSPVVTTSTLHLQDEATREVLGHTTAFLSMHGLPDTAGVLLGRHGGAAGLLAGQPLADDEEAGFAADAALAAGAGGSAFGAAGVAGSAPVVHIDRVGSAIDSSGSAVLATVFSAGMGSAAADQQQEELAAVSSFGADLAAVAQAAPPQQPVPDEPRGDAAPTPGTSAVVAGAEYGNGSAAWTTVPPEAYAAASSSGASRGRSSMAGSSAEASSQARASDELADSWEPVSCGAGSSSAGSSKLGAGSNSGGTAHAGSSSSSAVGTAAAEGGMAPQVRLRWAPLMGFARTQEAVYTQTLSTWYAHMDLTSFVILMLMFLVVTVKLIRQSAPAYNITMLWVVAHTVVGPYWVMLFKPQTYKQWREPLMLAMQVLNGCLYLCFATGWTKMPPEMTFHFNHSHIIQRGVVRPVRRPMRFRTHLLGTLIEAFCVTPAFASYSNPAHMWRTTALTYTLSLLVGYTLDYLARKVFMASQAAASSQAAAATATATSGCSVEEDAEGDAWLDPACAKAALRGSARGGSSAQSEHFSDLPTASCSSAASLDKSGAAAAPWKAKVA